MFVGDVRCATTGSGSWKLSGGSALSSAPDEGLEEPPRPARRRAAAIADLVAGERRAGADRGGGRLTQRATAG